MPPHARTFVRNVACTVTARMASTCEPHHHIGVGVAKLLRKLNVLFVSFNGRLMCEFLRGSLIACWRRDAAASALELRRHINLHPDVQRLGDAINA